MHSLGRQPEKMLAAIALEIFLVQPFNVNLMDKIGSVEGEVISF